MENVYNGGYGTGPLNGSQVGHPSNMAVNGSTGTASYSDEGSTLDHTLLESLFYDEIVQLDSTTLSPTILSQGFSEASNPSHRNPPAVHSVVADPNIMAEKDLLRDFGVTSSPIHASVPGPTVSMRTMEAAPWIHQAESTLGSNMAQQVAPQYVPTTLPMAPSTPTANPAVVQVPFAQSSDNPSANQMPVSHERAKQLVSQFATLASRLGIELPKSVLQSLTTAASTNQRKTGRPGGDYQHQLDSASSTQSQQDSASLEHASAHTEVDAHDTSSSPGNLDMTIAPTSTVIAPEMQESQKMADEAIAAVSGNRKRSKEESTASVSGTGSNAKPLYSKRRKKPRLSDCESKLAQLKSENELLKRHLENVSNKAHQFEQEKCDAGERIKNMLKEGAGPEQMEKGVQDFTEMYSDYGRRRQQELSFHLEQLQRLVNPTNFTKMGLWTLGQNSDLKRNPIAGILQTELSITPQQGRKIIDQREKIRTTCANLKECVALLARLKSLCAQKTQLFHDRMSKCREILTSKQSVKLIIWVNENYHLLESVCPGWSTEHIQSKAPPSKKN